MDCEISFMNSVKSLQQHVPLFNMQLMIKNETQGSMGSKDIDKR